MDDAFACAVSDGHCCTSLRHKATSGSMMRRCDDATIFHEVVVRRFSILSQVFRFCHYSKRVPCENIFFLAPVEDFYHFLYGLYGLHFYCLVRA